MHSHVPRVPYRISLFVFLALFSCSAYAQQRGETVDLGMVTQIRQEGFRNSQVMQTASAIVDGIGERLSGSPNVKKANEWTRDQFTKWGLQNAHLEGYKFGRGWQNEFTSVRMVSPDFMELIAYPKAWTPGTSGAIKAPAVRVVAKSPADFEKYRGKLSGKIVLYGDMPEVKPQAEAAMSRYDEKKLADIGHYEIPSEKPRFSPEEFKNRLALRKAADEFFVKENVVAVIDASRGDGGTVFVQSAGSYKEGEPEVAPSLSMAVEHFGRIARLLERGGNVELEVNVQNKFYTDDPTAYDTVAEIPGSDKKDELVMVGAHLDSWHAGTGATDNAAGCAVTMEAVRILQALGVKPRRTIRIALWTGEEEGLLGSRAYVEQHFGSRPESTDPKEKDLPSFLRKPGTPLTLKPEQKQVSAYFNIDNGSGKVRGIYLQENAAVAPIFTEWLKPFHDLGADTITYRNTGGTDHLSFDAVGIPGFQFIQDPIEYETRTHHSNMDVYERLQRDDLMQASVVLASFIYNAAMRDDMMPRKPLPKDAVLPPASAAPAKTPAKKK
ncbi:peptidase M28 [Candidatus Koribacter versatilis Ellin345]|uniref:Carboxypeptidase Q n=1 Tax=Koribacter versatilis (strain Ellin345) TaxID=204669 RepID=Q1IMF9_KORVE|nr:M20/M25/M40 family metallo-hydrolase [Candidatus Koribacter versatilis]ABF41941.1 peptidase M28 [Candidatus Koribacter versatilis Ellin345]